MARKLSEYVGGGYDEFWRYKGRYRVCKGSRASKKSKTTALWFIANLSKEKYRDANLLVVRKTYRTLKDSCFKELKWAINRLEQHQWVAKESPLEIENTDTGQKIYFRGLDDPLKVTSITVDKGVLCWAWLEEAYEVMKEDDFNVLDESIRGQVPEGLFKQWTITFNPWNEHHWLKKRFFDAPPDPDILALTTNYLCNEWLDSADIKVFEDMKRRNPRRYAVAGLGGWGIVDGLIYENWKEEEFSLNEIKNAQTAFGLDFGYSVDATAFVAAYIDQDAGKIYIYDEMYQTKMSNKMIYEKLNEMGYAKEKIIADSAEPKSIDELKGLGLRRIEPAKKGRDSINMGIQFIQNFEIIIHPRCVNFHTEISNYTWDKDKFGNLINTPIDDFNHCLDALRYGCERYAFKNRWLV